jgi:NADP-dependent 3-hydroxy acid dehydrogenase YdfG
MLSLENTAALITGASRGLGRHTAHALAEAGCDLVLVARNEAELQAVAREVEERGRRAVAVAGDVQDYATSQRAAEAAQQHFGRLDVVVANAGIGAYKPFLEHTPEELDATLGVNLRGLMYTCHAALPAMLEAQRGHIVCVASDVGRRPVAKMAPYVAAKHGVVGFAASLLREVKDRGVKVTTLMTGIVDTYFGGGAEGTREESWALRPRVVADGVVSLLRLPAHVVIDEVTMHPLGQEF